MATKLPTGQTLNAILTGVNSIALNALPTQHYAANLLPARMLLKGLLLTFIDHHIRNPWDDDPPSPTLEDFADVILFDFHNHMAGGTSAAMLEWISGYGKLGPYPTPLRRIGVTHLLTVLQDEAAARYGMMAVFDALGQHVTDRFAFAGSKETLNPTRSTEVQAALHAAA
jgi:hypothetical protein